MHMVKMCNYKRKKAFECIEGAFRSFSADYIQRDFTDMVEIYCLSLNGELLISLKLLDAALKVTLIKQ